MRPDRHKQAASRRYQAKAKARDGSSATSASTPGTGHGNPGTHHSRMAGHERHATQDDLMNDKDEEADYVSLKKYSRRKVVSNLDRYVEESEEVNEAEELEQGIDRQTMAFEELLLDSDQKHSFAEAAYFRFKSEKAAEDLEASVSTGSGLAADDNQHAQKWMEIRLDDLETSLMRLSFSDRLYLSEADQGFYEYDDASLVDDYTTQGASGGKVSFKAGTPIVPKLVRGEAAADILIQPSETTARVTAAAKSTAPVQQLSPAPGIKQLSNAETRRQQAKASKDQELDDLLDQSKRTVVSIRDLPRAQPLAHSPKASSGPLPDPLTAGSLAKLPSLPLAAPESARKVTFPVPRKPQGTSSLSPSLPRPTSKPAAPPNKSKSAANLDDEWLDSMLG